ncbi:uncharacterized protein Z519_08687 [Cladophialophora bantiana CBS 173.52]|uniref:Rhodopsin domain-containing protein n=1 Tax=Cladophialophora bantiana (strain ATCC 10958 / CBS 173.52 / CDC B-1940 / NIH 8579) TaxID=1442370 RepID=A0A0D2I1Z6_CLAB1|nr:uncharacterized protein Z519_08687 [Cladophialophora bantiana CBS 173.52]KIW90904.1 hypothetical protein Z519_08687 [Cladophialophora bantiana CBS 173.52]
MAVVSKVVSKLHLTFMKPYDWLIIASTITAFVQTACVIAACKHGLGQHRDAISKETFAAFSRYAYAAQILFVVACAFAKASAVSFILAIAPQMRLQQSSYALLGVVSCWAVSAVLALAFQCQLSHPWLFEEGKCIDQEALFLFIGIVNILTDLALVAIPSAMMWWVQTNTGRKWQVVALFASRIIVPVFVVFQLVEYHKFYESDDRSWKMVGPAILNQLVMNLSILTACIPSLKTVLDMFKSGTSFFTVPVQYQSAVDNSSQGLRSKLATAVTQRIALKRSANRSQNDTAYSSREWPTKQMKAVSGQHSVQISSNVRSNSDLKDIPVRSESQRSLTENTIMRTVAYEVGYEDMMATHHAAGSDGQSRVSINSDAQHSY